MNTRVPALISGLFFAFFLSAAARPVHACTCTPQTCEQSARAAVAVFEGLVVGIDPVDATADSAPTQLRVHMRVTETWTPGLSEQLFVRTRASGAACGYAFEVGRSYLVYADAGTMETPAVTLCSGTKRREDARDDVRFLGMGVVPVSPSQSIAATPVAPARGGCAGCSIGSRFPNATSATTVMVMTLGLLLLRRARRARSITP